MSIKDFQELENLFSSFEVKRIFIKFLAPKQDNDKNQIYFGQGSNNSIFHLLPCTLKEGTQSESRLKRYSSMGKPKIEAEIDFHWIDDNNNLSKAPNAKLIYYFQYPEVRFSGFISNCSSPPDCLRRKNQHEYGQRILIIGINKTSQIIGKILNEKKDPLVNSFPELKQHSGVKIFYSHIITKEQSKPKSASETLTDILSKNVVKTWHRSQTLRTVTEGPIPFKGNQGAGYTLEALLGIERNSSKTPDYLGIEIKSFSKSGKISLMTPTADLGDECMMSFRHFMQKYGHESVKRDGSIRFTGMHKFGKKNKKTKLTMEVRGYDMSKDTFIGSDSDILVGLYDCSSDHLVSGWSFKKLFDNWNKKHAEAFYIEYKKRRTDPSYKNHDFEYLYTGRVIYGMGTSINNYFKGICKGIIVYDPAHAIYADNTAKQRPQWRVTSTGFFNNIDVFYDDIQYFDL